VGNIQLGKEFTKEEASKIVAFLKTLTGDQPSFKMLFNGIYKFDGFIFLLMSFASKPVGLLMAVGYILHYPLSTKPHKMQMTLSINYSQTLKMTIVSGLRIIDSNAQTGITWWNWASMQR
jgi:hypothetical protein